jgi:uncharacterized repeat protein (TIGR01451 family)
MSNRKPAFCRRLRVKKEMKFMRKQKKPLTHQGKTYRLKRVTRVFFSTALPFLITFVLIFSQFSEAKAAGELSVEIRTSYNLVVDSNVLSPSTYAPSVATVIGEFCNTGDADLTDVQGFIGDFSAGTSGIYPSRDSSDPAFQAQHPHLIEGGGTYEFTHVGGALGTGDASRYIGTLAPGECSAQYWHFTYPRRENPNNTGPDPVWGDTNDTNDDLWLEFDVWGTSFEGSSNDASWTMTMRNTISALANKIKPNPDGRWFNTAADTIYPGETVTTNGINYEIGVVNKGFDNDNDFVPDYNAWLQPVGEPDYDPSCFRLIQTSGVLTVTRSGKPDMIIPFEDQLYFTNLPADNTGVTGKIFYEFLALTGPCSTMLTPYQEVASGYNNEKFNGDYGTFIPPISTYAPAVTIDKSSSPDVVSLGGQIDYSISFYNGGTTSAGLPLYGMPLAITDSIPPGMVYVAGSAGYSGVGTVTTLFSTDNRVTWSDAEPSAASVTDIQWRLNQVLGPSEGGTATFSVTVPGGYSGSPFIENTACIGFGDGPSFACDSTVTLLEGNNSIGDFVWQDDDGDGLQDVGEPGIDNVTVSLYWDRNGDGFIDSGDMLVMTDDSAGGGGYLFATLPDGRYLAQVDRTDADLPDGYHVTTSETYPVALDPGETDPNPVNYLDADFGFGPTLLLDKNLTSSNPAYEGDTVTYTIDLINTLPGDGTGQGAPCSYTVWAAGYDPARSGTGNKAWLNPQNLYTPPGPDGIYASAPFANAGENVGVTDFSLGPQAGNIITVDVLLPMDVIPTLAGTFDVRLWDNGVGLTPNTFDASTLVDGTLVVDVTADRTWSWSDFNGSLLTIQMIATKQGNPTGSLDVDAVGFRVTSDQTCGGPEDTITYLPLTDTYDPTKLEFVSATPAESSVAGGTITWDDLGPLYAGQTKTIILVFTALEPPDNDGDGENDATTITNCGDVTGATFANGDPVNDANDCVTSDLYPTGSIGDTVWNDNGLGGGIPDNGVQDGNEAGIPNVTIYLCTSSPCTSGNAVATAMTDANGNYLFDGLLDGTYYVAVDTASLPGSTFTQTGDPDSSCPGAGCDSQSSATINNNDGDSSNDDDLTMDFGYRVPNTIYGNVWEDNDGDGAQEAGENGIAGVDVYLDDCGADGICGNGDDGLTISTTTDADGNYVFSDLGDGNYRVRVDTTTLPGTGAWTNTADPEGDNNSQTDVLSISGGNVYGSYDFGYYQTGSSIIGDTLYRDWNGDGTQGVAEGGISNVTVSLYEDSNGDGVIDPVEDALIATTTTGANGDYSFTNLPAGDYIVLVDESDPDLPNDYVQTQDPDEGGVCTTCDGMSSVTGVDGTSSYLDEDFGYQPAGYSSIGDFVWQDDDGDGVQDAGEAGIQNITVTLYQDQDGDGVYDPGIDALVATMSTDADGEYTFENLPAGNYLVDVDTGDADLPTDGYGQPYVLSTGNDPLAVSLGAVEDYTDADFGFTAGGTIGDFIWQDNNGDGNQDIGEPGINNVIVSLYVDVNGDGDYDPGTDTFYASDTTGGDGLYQFNSLPADDYVVVVTPPAGYTPSGDPDEGNPCSTCDNESGLTLLPGRGYLVDRHGRRWRA